MDKEIKLMLLECVLEGIALGMFIIGFLCIIFPEFFIFLLSVSNTQIGYNDLYGLICLTMGLSCTAIVMIVKRK